MPNDLKGNHEQPCKIPLVTTAWIFSLLIAYFIGDGVGSNSAIDQDALVLAAGNIQATENVRQSEIQQTEELKRKAFQEVMAKTNGHLLSSQIGRIYRRQSTLEFLHNHYPACEIVNIAYGSHVQKKAGGAEAVYFVISSSCPPDES